MCIKENHYIKHSTPERISQSFNWIIFLVPFQIFTASPKPVISYRQKKYWLGKKMMGEGNDKQAIPLNSVPIYSFSLLISLFQYHPTEHTERLSSFKEYSGLLIQDIEYSEKNIYSCSQA